MGDPKKKKSSSNNTDKENKSDNTALTAAAISAKYKQQQKEKEKEEKRYENEDQAPYVETKNNIPRINTEKKLSSKEQLVADMYARNPDAYGTVEDYVKKVDEKNQNKVEATLKNQEGYARANKQSQQFWNDQLRMRNKQSKKWGD